MTERNYTKTEQSGQPSAFLGAPSRQEWLRGARTVGELRAFLRDFPKDIPVVFRDGEDRENAISSVVRTRDTVELA